MTEEFTKIKQRVVDGCTYTAEVRPAFRQYHALERWTDYFDWQVVLENDNRPRWSCGTAKGRDLAVSRALGSLSKIPSLEDVKRMTQK